MLGKVLRRVSSFILLIMVTLVAWSSVNLAVFPKSIVASGTFSHYQLDKQRHYDHKVLTYTIEPQSPYYQKVWKTAVKEWNTSIEELNGSSSPALVQAPDKSTSADITLLATDNFDYGSLSVTGTTIQTYYRKQVFNSRVRLSIKACDHYKYTFRQRVSVAEHELGHAMGLPHSKDKGSLMYPTQTEDNIAPGDVLAVKYLMENNW